MPDDLPNIIGCSAAVQDVLRQVRLVAPTEATQNALIMPISEVDHRGSPLWQVFCPIAPHNPMPPTSSTRQNAVKSAVVRVMDKADEVRVEIEGILNSERLFDLQTVWEDSQSTLFWRRFVVAISKLDGFDSAGLALLHKMYRQGVVFSASTPSSLLLLKEIAGELHACS
jgi:hypothetical protein